MTSQTVTLTMRELRALLAAAYADGSLFQESNPDDDSWLAQRERAINTLIRLHVREAADA